MIELCIFDLDETLLRTDDLEQLRDAGRSVKDLPSYAQQVRSAFQSRPDRFIYTETDLLGLLARFNGLKLGVFTRSPRQYAIQLLHNAYPTIPWTTLVAYEDVPRNHWKPNGYGIRVAMNVAGIARVQSVMMVGDTDVDIRAAYNAGCIAVLDKSAWPFHKEWGHWRAEELVPDAMIDSPQELTAVLDNFESFLPEFEWQLVQTTVRSGRPRFQDIGHFVPRQLGGTNTPVKISIAGRHFANYESLAARRSTHALTQEIHDRKDATSFPPSWTETIRLFIAKNYPFLQISGPVLLTSIPARPGRNPRLSSLIGQVARSISTTSQAPAGVIAAPEVLAYHAGVRSNSSDRLTQIQRFENVRDHLYVPRPDLVQNRNILVIDDVVTTGSTLIYAKNYLHAAGALNVACLALTKNVSNVL